MKDCLFCKIISGEIPSYKIYEDDDVYAFLDIADDVYGHTVVVPKRHCDNMYECGPRTFAKFMAAVKKIADHYIDDCGFDGYNIINNTGFSAEQSVMHLHYHILPRKSGGSFKLWKPMDKLGSDFEKVKNELFLENKTESLLDYSKYAEECDVLYTDGACSNNPGMGGYGGVYITTDGKGREFSGGEDNTTNNRMELTAVIEGLKLVDEGKKVKVYSDSAYVVNAYQQNWLASWKRNGWRASSGGDVLNSDLWKELDELVQARNVEFIKVKGHSDNVLNNRCDALATSYYKAKE